MTELEPLDDCPFCGCGIDNSEPRPFPAHRQGAMWWVARCGNPDCAAEIEAPSERLATERWNRREHLAPLVRASLAYDNAIRECGNDPEKMASFCSAEGDDLDALYALWMTLAYSFKERHG